MLQGPPPDAAGLDDALAAFGLVRADASPAGPQDSDESDVCEVWLEHWPALRIFGAMQTQWVHGFNGRTGLNYAALPAVERRLGISPRKARQAFPHLQALEAEALRFFAQQG